MARDWLPMYRWTSPSRAEVQRENWNDSMSGVHPQSSPPKEYLEIERRKSKATEQQVSGTWDGRGVCLPVPRLSLRVDGEGGGCRQHRDKSRLLSTVIQLGRLCSRDLRESRRLPAVDRGWKGCVGQPSGIAASCPPKAGTVGAYCQTCQ